MKLYNYFLTKIIFIILISLTCLNLDAQKKSRFSIGISFGPQGDFSFTKYDEIGGPVSTRFYKKEFLGLYGGLDIKYRMGKKNSTLVFGYSKTQNTRNVNFEEVLNNVPLGIRGFNIRHINNNYKLTYETKVPELFKGFGFEFGLLYTRSRQQEIEINPGTGGIYIDERTYKSHGMEEGGLILGLSYTKKIDTKFEFGVRTRVYYLASIITLTNLSFTPTLIYHF